jgi:hypothetical protein
MFKFKTVRATTQIKVGQVPCPLNSLKPALACNATRSLHFSRFFHLILFAVAPETPQPFPLLSIPREIDRNLFFSVASRFRLLIYVIYYFPLSSADCFGSLSTTIHLQHAQICSGKNNYLLLNRYIIKRHTKVRSQVSIQLRIFLVSFYVITPSIQVDGGQSIGGASCY